MTKFTLSITEAEFIIETLRDWKQGLIEMKLKYGKVSKLIKKLESRLTKLNDGGAIPPRTKVQGILAIFL